MYGRSKAGSSIQAVVKAWKEGRPCKRGNAYTDGRTYWLFGNAIAKHVPMKDVVHEVTKKLRGERYEERGPFFTFAGWPRQTTERHLEALGLRCYKGRSGVPPTMMGRAVNTREWYSVEQLEAMPLYAKEVKTVTSSCARFVQATAPLFG